MLISSGRNFLSQIGGGWGWCDDNKPLKIKYWEVIDKNFFKESKIFNLCESKIAQNRVLVHLVMQWLSVLLDYCKPLFSPTISFIRLLFSDDEKPCKRNFYRNKELLLENNFTTFWNMLTSSLQGLIKSAGVKTKILWLTQ